MMKQWLRLGLLVILGLVGVGCGMTPRGVHQVGNWGPVKVLEDGEIKELYTKQLCENRGPMLVRIESLISDKEVLTERPTTWTHGGFNDGDAKQLWNDARP